MKIAVIYKSVLGTTQKYATWLSQDLSADLYHYDVKETTLQTYDVVIVASGTYASGMPLVQFLKKHWPVLSSKKVIVLAVGILAPDDEQSKKSYDLIPETIKSSIHYFKLPGKLFKAGSVGSPTKDKLQPILDLVSILTP